jgi:hypothetical protein
MKHIVQFIFDSQVEAFQDNAVFSHAESNLKCEIKIKEEEKKRRKIKGRCERGVCS